MNVATAVAILNEPEPETAVGAAPASKPEIENVTPEIIAKMSQAALASCAHASEQLRELGDYAGAMGEQVKREFYRLADDFDEHGRTVAQQVVNFATDIHAKGVQAQELRKTLPQAGPRIVSKT